MKTITLLFLVMMSAVGVTYAQTDAKAKVILAGVSKKYKSYDVIKADFTFTLDNQQAKLKESQQGTLLAKAKAS